MIRPGLTRATQSSGEPLPEPMRTSAGRRDTGPSGTMRSHVRPARVMWRATARRAALLHFGQLPVGGHRIVLDDLALEHPDLDADDAIGRTRHAVAEVDVGTQRMQRHAAFAIPLGTGDLGAAQTAGDVDPDAD